MAEKKVDFKSMSKQQKKAYIWDYYRYHIIIGIVIAVYAITTLIQNYNTVSYPYQLVLLGGSSYSDYDALASFEEQLTEVALPNHNEKEAAKVQLYSLEKIESTMDPMITAFLQKFIVQVAAKELDVVLLNEADFQYFHQQGMFAPLNDRDGLELNLIDENRLIIDETDHNIYGIKLKDSALFKSINYLTGNKVLTIVNNAKHDIENVQVINWILKQCE